MLFGIQGARGVGAFLVVLYHVSIWSDEYYHTVWNGFFNFGYIGVDFFFVLSGFIIFYIHRNDGFGILPWKKYFIKRIIRIYPPFIPISLALLFFFLAFPEIGKGKKEISILSSIFLIPSSREPALEVSWTLMHEMLFYVFFSFYFFFRKHFSIISVLWIVGIFTNMVIRENNYLVSFLFNTHNLEFFLGMGVAISVDKYGKYYKEAFIVGNILTLLFIFIRYSGYIPQVFSDDNIEIVYLGIAFSFIVYGIYGFDKNSVIRYPKLLLLLGSASYSIYLIHYPLVSIFNRGASRIYPHILSSHNLIFFIIVGLCVTAGCIYHLMYEKKFLMFLRKRLIH